MNATAGPGLGAVNSSGGGVPTDTRLLLLFQFYTWGVAGSTIAALGVLGNVCSIVILSYKNMRSSSSVYMTALAVFDSVVLVSLLLFLALPTVHLVTGRLRSYFLAYPYMHPWAYPTALTAQTCSIYTTVVFTVERYWVVSRPLSASRVCKESRARWCILALVVCSVLYNAPRMFEYRVVEEIHNNRTTARVYFIYLYMTIMLLVPFTTLGTLNALLMRAVRVSQRATGRVSSKLQREHNTAVMLASVVMVFLICHVPSIADNFFSAILDQKTLLTAPYVKLSCISNLMVIINSASNFYLYCCFGQKFRRQLIKCFCGVCRRHSTSQSRTTFFALSLKRNAGPSMGEEGPCDAILDGEAAQWTAANGLKTNTPRCASPDKRLLD